VIADPLAQAAAPSATSVAAAPIDEVLRRLDSSTAGLPSAEAAARLTRYGPNAVRTHHVNALAVLGRQLRNAVLILLAGTAIVSYFLGDSMQATIIGIILLASIGLGFINEYRAERAAADLHASVHHNAVVRRDGEFVALAVTALVPGDVIRLSLGEAVPADVRLIDVIGLECNESILTGESTGSEKSPQPAPPGTDLADATDLAFMGTIVSAGEGTGVVYATGRNAEFGRIASGLDERQPETGFQVLMLDFDGRQIRKALLDSPVDLVRQGRAARRSSLLATTAEGAEGAGVGVGRCCSPSSGAEDECNADQKFRNHLAFEFSRLVQRQFNGALVTGLSTAC
jgi:P-type Mg2+ transporter